MSLKAELETWAAALKAYDEEDFEKALDLFSRIADSSKILTNMGLIYATLGEHEAAVEQFNAATQLDQYLAVAYFQCGVSNFLLGRYELSLRDFDEALLYLRGNQAINYEQLGLKFKLFSAEVLFNKGLSQIYLGRVEMGLQDMQAARGEKATDEHNVIDDAIADRGEGYTVFSIPVGVLYRPSENKLRNAKTKDYMGKARLVAATSVDEAYTEFTGVTRLQRGYTPSGAPVDRPMSEPSASLTSPTQTQAPSSALSRAQTVPPPRNVVDDLSPRAAGGLARSRTVLPVAEGARERRGVGESGRSSPGPGPGPGPGAGGLQRSATSVRPPMRGNASADSGMADRANQGFGGTGPGSGMVRGLSVRKNTGSTNSPTMSMSSPPPPPEKAPGAPRLTEIYDNYMDGYENGDAPRPPESGAPAQGQGGGRVAAWARTNANPANLPSRAPSTRAPSAYAASSAGSLRRKPTRRPTVNRGPSRAMSAYEEEEEGYVSGEYDEGTFELSKIRLKLYYQGDVRGMTMTPDMPFEEFVERVTQKFNTTLGGLSMKFKDEDGGKITLQDDSDFELAVETARELAKGRAEGRLEIWLTDI